MKREHIINPEGFESIEGKLKIINDSLDGLLEATERFARHKDEDDLLAAMLASLIALHQVVEGLLRDELGSPECT